MDIRTAVFEDNKLIRDALQTLLNGSPGYTCCGVFPDGNHWERDIKNAQPDVVLMDIEMPGINGIEVTSRMHEKYPDIKIMIQTVFKDTDKIFHSLCAGASGYMLKNDPLTKQLDAIREVYNGGAAMSPFIAKKVLEFFSQKNVILVPPEATDYQLSTREKEILTLVTQGHNYRTIAEKAFISYETVRTHVKKIYKKLHVASRSEAILKAKQQGLV
jgi:DNA-binding NarL/FixJ family response regulator